MKKLLTRADFDKLLDTAIKEAGSQLAFAKQHQFSPAYISDVRAGNRAPGPRMLTIFGLRRVERFERIE